VNGNAGRRISFCNGRFFAPAGPGTNLVSTDGLSWSLLTNTTASSFGRVIYGNGIYAALGDSKLFTSTDGTNWVQRNMQAPANAVFLDLVFGNRNLVVVGYASSIIYTPLIYISDPIVSMESNPDIPHQFSIAGLQGHSYRIDYLDGMQTNNWNTLATLTLTNSPVLWTDSTATNSKRFYRTVLLP
jgi:hypothetical protein